MYMYTLTLHIQTHPKQIGGLPLFEVTFRLVMVKCHDFSRDYWLLYNCAAHNLSIYMVANIFEVWSATCHISSHRCTICVAMLFAWNLVYDGQA